MLTMKCRRCNGTGKELDPKAYGAYMRGKRKAANKTLRELGVIIGVSHAYLWDLETGKRRWNDDITKRFLKAVGG